MRGRTRAPSADPTPSERPAAPGAVAVGLYPHTGWTWLVRVATGPHGAAVEARVRVVACDVLDGELYHLAAEHTGDLERFVATKRVQAVRQAAEAVAPHVAGATQAVVLGKTMALPPLLRIVAAHPMIHGAEGELWRAVFAEACAAQGLAVVRRDAGAAREALARRRSPAQIAAFLTAGRQRVGSPWSREPQDAALAAWGALA